MNILQMFSYPFMQRALIAGVLVSLCAALLGVPLVLKRYSMIGDGLSHVSFGALAIAVALGVTPLYFSIPVVILAAFFLLRMASHPHWNSDAAIAAVSASALAIGILVISRTTGMTTDVDNYMFGSVLAMTKGDVALSVVLSVTVLTLRARKGARFSTTWRGHWKKRRTCWTGLKKRRRKNRCNCA